MTDNTQSTADVLVVEPMLDSPKDETEDTPKCINSIDPDDRNGEDICEPAEYVSDDDNVDRAAWGNKMEFIFTCIGYAVGLGNVWRFPYLCYKNGGGAFLIPYCVMLAAVGLPLFYMELAFGQFASLGPIKIWRINPLFKGLGYAMVIVSWLISLYYNVIIAHVFFYMFASMTDVLPWTTCNNVWNTNSCLPFNATISKNDSLTPAEEYYKYYVLEQSDSITEFGSVSWKLALCLLAAWIIVGICLVKGIQSLGKVVYFTAIFPYVMLAILLVRGVTLDGAVDGIIYYLKPEFSRLADPRVWSDAATQIFYSLSACTGGLIALSSFNKFSNNCRRDAITVAIINCATSIFAGFVIFSILGFMAHVKEVEVSKVAAGGPGLAFVVYPEAIAQMPVAPLWAVFFFLMMATLGFGSQFSIVECVMAAFIDELSSFLKDRKYATILFRCAIVVVSFLLGLPMVCKGGIYLLNLVDFSVGGFPLLVVGLLEILAINWIYGFDRFSEDVEMMVSIKPNIYWKVCWKYVSPIVIAVTVICNMALYKEPTHDNKAYPMGFLVLGWLIVLFPILVVPIHFLSKYCNQGGFQLMKVLMNPLPSWHPAKPENRFGSYMSAGSQLVTATDLKNSVSPGFRFGSNISNFSTPMSSTLNLATTQHGVILYNKGKIGLVPHGSRTVSPIGSRAVSPHGSRAVSPHGSRAVTPHGSTECLPHHI